MTTRRDFLKHSALGAAGLTIGGLGFSTESFANIMGANEKIRVGIVGFSDRARHSLIPAFMACADELGFEIVAISDIWKRRREEGVAFFQEKYGKKVKAFRTNIAHGKADADVDRSSVSAYGEHPRVYAKIWIL